jgi:hypothetical protein
MKKVFPKFPPGGKALPHRHLHQAEDGQVHHGGEREDVRGAGRKELQQGRKVYQMFFQKITKYFWECMVSGRVITIDIESHQNRLLKVCYLPAASAGFPRVSFFFSFFFVAVAINSTNEANKASSTCH